MNMSKCLVRSCERKLSLIHLSLLSQVSALIPVTLWLPLCAYKLDFPKQQGAKSMCILTEVFVQRRKDVAPSLTSLSTGLRWFETDGGTNQKETWISQCRSIMNADASAEGRQGHGIIWWGWNGCESFAGSKRFFFHYGQNTSVEGGSLWLLVIVLVHSCRFVNV